MAENKTQPTDADVSAYLDSVAPEKRREDGFALDAIFREVTGEEPVMWGPSIVGYGRYRYRSPVNPRNHGEWPATGFSPRRTQLSLYGLKDLPAGRSCSRSSGSTPRVPAASMFVDSRTSTRRCCADSSRSPQPAPTILNPAADHRPWPGGLSATSAAGLVTAVRAGL
ncbi:hypothetical protein [Brevibacterium sp. CFH 10365]|uniref:hypothetical protein n=1 Tax=Brevibacterium sp. CFH 10365 TaxID=2585207 RepID=UPI0029D413CD|nr:hypothetical protein [Brevibacterium sp. CFH 10365]